jgi:hypothetical protein
MRHLSIGRSVVAFRRRLVAAPEAAHANGEVVLHDLPDLGFAEYLVGSQRILDASRRIGRRPRRHQPQVLRGVGVVTQFTQPASEFRGSSQRGHPIAPDEPGNGGMIHPGLLGELSLRHLLGFELGSQPLVERSTVLARHRAGGRSLLALAASAAISPLSGEEGLPCITRSYRPRSPVGRKSGLIGAVGCGLCQSIRRPSSVCRRAGSTPVATISVHTPAA